MIALNNLTVSYRHHPALHHISGSFAKGSLTAVVGPNGAGNTTLLRVISGLIRPRAGTLRYGGRDLLQPVIAQEFVAQAVACRVGRAAEQRHRREVGQRPQYLNPVGSEEIGVVAVRLHYAEDVITIDHGECGRGPETARRGVAAPRLQRRVHADTVEHHRPAGADRRRRGPLRLRLIAPARPGVGRAIGPVSRARDGLVEVATLRDDTTPCRQRPKPLDRDPAGGVEAVAHLGVQQNQLRGLVQRGEVLRAGPQAALKGAALGDVARHADNPGRPALGIVEHARPGFRPDRAAVLARLLDLDGVALL